MTEKQLRELVASRIRRARELAGLSQAQVAKILDVHRPTISEIEAGNRSVSAEEISRLAKLFQVSSSWLVGEAVDKVDPRDEKLQFAARELRKLKEPDLKRLLEMLPSLRTQD